MSTPSRLTSVDLARGIIMVVMALDHTRDFFGIPGQNPIDLGSASAALFLTRWITFFCAPGFFLLTGTGTALAQGRTSTAVLSRRLLTRGLWLMVLEATVVRTLAYQFNADYQVTMLLVLWALGWAMVVLAGLVWLPLRAVVAFGVILVVGHNLLDGIRSAHPLWAVLHTPGFLVNEPGRMVFVAYPLVPWTGVTALGFALGRVYQWDADRRRAFLLRLGLSLSIGFVLVRGLNVYGDPRPWSPQPSALFTVLSFLNTNKYPPSLSFLLMTLGPLVLLLRALERPPRWLEPVTPIGRVPLFYYVGHFALIHLVAVGVCLVRYGTAHWMFESPDLGNYPFTPPPGWGYSLPVVYLIWALVVAAMYPLCARYAGFKARSRSPWLYYL